MDYIKYNEVRDYLLQTDPLYSSNNNSTEDNERRERYILARRWRRVNMSRLEDYIKYYNCQKWVGPRCTAESLVGAYQEQRNHEVYLSRYYHPTQATDLYIQTLGIDEKYILRHYSIEQLRNNMIEWYKDEKYTGSYPKTGSWGMDKGGTVWEFLWLPLGDCIPGEGDWDIIINHESTQRYIKWFKEGFTCPPLFVVQCKNGKTSSLNRRRWLAARAAGIEVLPCWYSPSTETGMPKWSVRFCTLDGNRICEVYKQGGDCTTCDYYRSKKDEA